MAKFNIFFAFVTTASFQNRNQKSTAFVISRSRLLTSLKNNVHGDGHDDAGTPQSWSVTDDWSTMSSIDSAFSFDTDDMFEYGDALTIAASKMDATPVDGAPTPNNALNEEDIWVSSLIDNVNHNGFVFEPSPGDVPLYDTGYEDYTQSEQFTNDISQEISLLVRCNEHPEHLLVHEGRALPPLSKEEMNDVTQLIDVATGQPTEFLEESISLMFDEHSSVEKDTDVRVLDSAGVARWMTKALGGSNIGPHDKRVTMTISKHGTYGSGKLYKNDFMNLYLSVLSSLTAQSKSKSTGEKETSYYSAATVQKSKSQSQPTLESVWRDIRNHDIMSPIEFERSKILEEIESKHGRSQQLEIESKQGNSLYDECEILEWGDSIEYSKSSSSSSFEKPSSPGNGMKKSTGGKSSHQLVELASDNKTPKRLRDGDFIFIDEESCIGCNNCADIAPSSFLMREESGRARTYFQRNTVDVLEAVSSCPVNCMHRVSFDELCLMEAARDDEANNGGSGVYSRSSHIPLHVAGIDSDANRRSSFYHNLKQACHMSKSCPQRGCYDCPHYNAPGDNPFWKRKHQKAEHIRATDFINEGEADMWRKTEDL